MLRISLKFIVFL